jgi:hypothetical protein
MPDRSGAITTGGQSQTLAEANPGRTSLVIQNLSNADLWYSFKVAATLDKPSFKLPPNDLHVFGAEHASLMHDAIYITGATTGQKFSARDGER